MESLEIGCRLLLLDEDTSATNFMIRDERMQELVHKESEPITPFVDKVRQLFVERGVSTVLVMGGSGDYFDHADTVIQMNAYEPEDVTSEAHELAERLHTGRVEEHDSALQPPRPRCLDPRSLDPDRRPGRQKIQARGRDTLVFGKADVDLRAVEQIADPSQVRTIGYLLANFSELQRGFEPVAEIALRLQALADGGWDELNGRPDGDLALPRLHEVMAALSRMRGVTLE